MIRTTNTFGISLFFLVLFYGFSTPAKGNVGSFRGLQLDSIITYIDKPVLKNLDSLHHYIEKHARSNEERVWMYFSTIAIHYKYDKKRAGQRGKRSQEYTPYYTAFKRKGVCRDFAALMKELCDRSNIPCIVVTGRAKVNLFEAVKDIAFRRFKKSNHAWNLIKYDSYWHTVDATWSYVKDVKRRKFKVNGRWVRSRIKVPFRDYYDPMYEDIFDKRKAEHPALYAENTVYTHETVYKKKKKRVIHEENYAFSPILDSLSQNKFYRLSLTYCQEAMNYSNNSSAGYYIEYYLNFLKLKRSKFNRLNREECKRHLDELTAFEQYIKMMDNLDVSYIFAKHKTIIKGVMEGFPNKQESLGSAP